MFNTMRTYPAPPSLDLGNKYDGQDVFEELRKIFFDKCYICETKDPHDINVEHFFSHEGNREKKFEWDNLYLACSRCNNIKGTAYNDMLDCCHPEQNVFLSIKHLPPMSPRGKSVAITATTTDLATIKTAELLSKVFNSDHSINKRISSEYLRSKVFAQYNLLIDQMDRYYHPVATEGDKEDSLERMKILILKKQPYSAFIRWCILDDHILGPILKDFMD